MRGVSVTNRRATERNDVKLVESILVSASRLTGAGVCIYDLKKLFDHTSSELLERDLKGHYCDFCSKLRELPGGREACIRSDVHEAVELANKHQNPFFHTCHIGLTELIVPVTQDGQVIAVVFLGQGRLVGETEFPSLWSKLSQFGAEEEVFKGYFEALPLVERSTLLDAAALVDLSFKYLISTGGYGVWETYYMTVAPEDHVHRAVQYIENHSTENITAKDVVEHVHLNASYFARLFKRTVGCSITDYILGKRLEKAKSLLATTGLPIQNIALIVGFLEHSYFTRKFHEVVGCSPTDYRMNSGGSS